MLGSSQVDLRPGVRANFLVRRRLRFVSLPGLSSDTFHGLIGFNRLWLKGECCWFEYDASRLHIDQLLSRLVQADVLPARDALNRFRLGWYRYQDSNIAANARDNSSTSCAKSPLRHR